MSRRKYLWRVTAHYSQAQPPREWTTVRHYQSLSAALHRARLLQQGRPAKGGYGHAGDSYFESAIEKADRVVVERSAPVEGWMPLDGANQ